MKHTVPTVYGRWQIRFLPSWLVQPHAYWRFPPRIRRYLHAVELDFGKFGIAIGRTIDCRKCIKAIEGL